MIKRLLLLPTLASFGFLVACTVQTTSSDSGADAGNAGDAGTMAEVGPTSDGGTISDGGGTSDSGLGCGFGEPNEGRDQAKAIELGKTYDGLCLTDDDEDWFEFVAPGDGSTGFATISLTYTEGSLSGEAYLAGPNRKLGDGYTSEGETLTLHFAMVPKETYRVKITGRAAAYTMSSKYTTFADSFEPNDKKEDAKAITTNSPISAFMNGYACIPGGDECGDDWYAVDLAAGEATFKLENVATDTIGHWTLCNMDGSTVIDGAPGRNPINKYGNERGESVTDTRVVPAAGRYLVRVSSFLDPTIGSATLLPPDVFTRPYSFSITQR
jgi:hypothetical protein